MFTPASRNTFGYLFLDEENDFSGQIRGRKELVDDGRRDVIGDIRGDDIGLVERTKVEI